ESGLRLLCDGPKSRDVVHGELGEHLAIDFEPGLREAVDEATVRETVHARGRVDARDPERAELTLLRAAVAIGVLACLDDRLLRRAVNLTTGVVVALRFCQNFFVTAAGLDATFDSCHLLSPQTLKKPSIAGRLRLLFRFSQLGAFGFRDVALADLARR